MQLLVVTCRHFRFTHGVGRYEMAVAFNPNCVEAYNNLGVILREQGRLDKALSCYQAALQLRPNFPQGLNNLAVVFTAQVT
jgi:protein O-GlcNAc transferase